MKDAIVEGARLFNRRAYFESHEVFEAAWREADGADRDFLGALVQLGAALHAFFERGSSRVARQMLAQTLPTLEDFRPAAHDVDVDRLIKEVEEFVDRIREAGDRKPGFLDRWVVPRIRLLGVRSQHST